MPQSWPNPLACPTCAGETLVQLERPGIFADPNGKALECPDCRGSGVARCFYRFACRGDDATQVVDDRPCCVACARECELAMHASEVCWMCGNGEPIAIAGPDHAPTCDRCLTELRMAALRASLDAARDAKALGIEPYRVLRERRVASR